MIHSTVYSSTNSTHYFTCAQYIPRFIQDIKYYSNFLIFIRSHFLEKVLHLIDFTDFHKHSISNDALFTLRILSEYK